MRGDLMAEPRMAVYGLKVSYFTGKLEAYLRCKGIPYDFRTMTVRDFRKRIPEMTGAMQMPAVQLPDGRWMTDTSPIIEWLESEFPDPPIIPADPALAFICHLIEDYADEWLWRPAMYYRWNFPVSAKLLARQIVDEMAPDLRAPRFLARLRTERRQRGNFVTRDGASETTAPHIEQSYLRLLAILSDIFGARPFVVCDRPTLADIGLMGPLFRHFSMDPAPAKIMREDAPAVMEWVYRVWNAKPPPARQPDMARIPGDLGPLLSEIAETHLEALNANARAWEGGQERHTQEIQGVRYTNIPTSRYRVWCLEKLRQRYRALEGAAHDEVDAALAASGALEPLLRLHDIASRYDEDARAPFCRSIPVFENVID